MLWVLVVAGLVVVVAVVVGGIFLANRWLAQLPNYFVRVRAFSGTRQPQVLCFQEAAF
jgi:hypothetical protein